MEEFRKKPILQRTRSVIKNEVIHIVRSNYDVKDHEVQKYNPPTTLNEALMQIQKYGDRIKTLEKWTLQCYAIQGEALFFLKTQAMKEKKSFFHYISENNLSKYIPSPSHGNMLIRIFSLVEKEKRLLNCALSFNFLKNNMKVLENLVKDKELFDGMHETKMET